MGSLNDSFQSLNFFCCCCSLLVSVNGKTYNSAIKRPIKIETHHVLRKHTHRLTNGRQEDSWTNVQMYRGADFSKSDTHELNF